MKEKIEDATSQAYQDYIAGQNTQIIGQQSRPRNGFWNKLTKFGAPVAATGLAVFGATALYGCDEKPAIVEELPEPAPIEAPSGEVGQSDGSHQMPSEQTPEQPTTPEQQTPVGQTSNIEKIYTESFTDTPQFSRAEKIALVHAYVNYTQSLHPDAYIPFSAREEDSDHVTITDSYDKGTTFGDTTMSYIRLQGIVDRNT